jgi:hypothetical protein
MTARAVRHRRESESPSASAPAWHGSQDLCSAFVAAVVHVNKLAARERNALAHFHERLAPWALRRRRFQAGPPIGSALARRSQYLRPCGSVELVPDTRSGRKGLPSLQWPIPSRYHVDGNRGLGDRDAELEQFAVNLGSAPQRVSKLILRIRSRTSRGEAARKIGRWECVRARRALGFSLRAQSGTGRPLAELGTPPPQHCPEVRCDVRAHSGRTIE